MGGHIARHMRVLWDLGEYYGSLNLACTSTRKSASERISGCNDSASENFISTGTTALWKQRHGKEVRFIDLNEFNDGLLQLSHLFFTFFFFKNGIPHIKIQPDSRNGQDGPENMIV